MISFIVVAYNSERTIGGCLESIASQRCRKELIVVDGGSNDRTREIAKRFRPRLLRDTGGRISSARNVGLKAAKGSHIAFIDSDVALPEGWCGKALRLLARDRRIAGVGGPGISPDKGIVSESLNRLLYGKSPKSEMYVSSLATMDVLYRKAALKGQLFDETLVTGEDPEFNMRLVKGGRRLLFSRELWVWHHHPVSLGGLVRKWYNYGTNYPAMASKHREFRDRGYVVRLSFIPVLLGFSLLSLLSPILISIPVLQAGLLYLIYLIKGFRVGMGARAPLFAGVHWLKQLAQLLGTFVGLRKVM